MSHTTLTLFCPVYLYEIMEKFGAGKGSIVVDNLLITIDLPPFTILNWFNVGNLGLRRLCPVPMCWWRFLGHNLIQQK